MICANTFVWWDLVCSWILSGYEKSQRVQDKYTAYYKKNQVFKSTNTQLLPVKRYIKTKSLISYFGHACPKLEMLDFNDVVCMVYGVFLWSYYYLITLLTRWLFSLFTRCLCQECVVVVYTLVLYKYLNGEHDTLTIKVLEQINHPLFKWKIMSIHQPYVCNFFIYDREFLQSVPNTFQTITKRTCNHLYRSAKAKGSICLFVKRTVTAFCLRTAVNMFSSNVGPSNIITLNLFQFILYSHITGFMDIHSFIHSFLHL